ncbi:MAG: membrane protein insertase YidC, partial [Rhodoferax sp.]
MNDIRRTILWVIFGFSMVLLWDQWQVFNGRKATFFPSAVNTVPAASPSPSVPASDVPTGVPTSNTVAASAQITGAAAQLTPSTEASAAVHERLLVTTDVLKLTFDTEGASLIQTEFVQHADMADKSKKFILLDNTPSHTYMAQTGLIAGAAGGTFPTHKTVMVVAPGERALQEGSNELVIRFESPEVGGVKLIKTFTFTRGSYAVTVRHEVMNVGATAVSPQLYLQLVRDGSKPLGESSLYSTFTGPAIYTEAKKYQKVDFKDIENNKVDVEKTAENGYVAMVQHYFASAWLLGDGIKRDLFLRKVDTNLYAVGMITPMDSIAPGASKALEAKFFAGPQEEKVLESLSPGLELVKDYGWLTILSKPLYWLLHKLE